MGKIYRPFLVPDYRREQSNRRGLWTIETRSPIVSDYEQSCAYTRNPQANPSVVVD